MKSKQAAVLNTLTRVQRYLDTNDASLGTINRSTYRAVLDDVVTNLSAHATNQTTSKRIGAAQTAKARVLRNMLKLNHMRPIATIAAAQLRQVPEFVALKMPPATSTSRALVAWAGAMGTAATAYEQTFVAAGLAPDFLAQLAAASDALNASIANRQFSRTTLAAATAGLRAEVTRGRQAVRVLNSLVEPQLAGDTPLLAQWNTAKRFTGRSAPIANTTIDASAKGPMNTNASAHIASLSVSVTQPQSTQRAAA